jgi:hypothetical protein
MSAAIANRSMKIRSQHGFWISNGLSITRSIVWYLTAGVVRCKKRIVVSEGVREWDASTYHRTGEE